jgi:uncharacterized protein YegL
MTVSRFRKPYEDLGDLDLEGVDIEPDGAQQLLLTLVLDSSKSMAGAPIDSLNEGLQQLVGHLRRDRSLRAIANVALITFGHNGVIAWRGSEPAPPGVSPFVPVYELTMPRLPAGGVTPMVEAVQHAIYWVNKEKSALRERGIQYYQPLIWLISDGLPTDGRGQLSEDWKHLARTLRQNEAENHLIFLTVSAANISPDGDAVLRHLSPRGHVKLVGMDFRPVLRLVSSSAGRFAQGNSVDAVYDMVAEFQQVPAGR